MASEAMKLVTAVEQLPGIGQDDLASRLNTSTRTLRTWVRRVNHSLAGCASIELRRGKGYELRVIDGNGLSAWKSSQGTCVRHALPESREDRIAYLVNDLLQRSDWVTIDTLATVLCVSRVTISQSLRQVEVLLGDYGLTLSKRPHHGIKVVGSEMDRRLCLASIVAHNRAFAASREENGCGVGSEALQERPDAWDGAFSDRIRAVTACVDETLAGESFEISSVAHQNLVVHIAVATYRIESGHYVPIEVDNLKRIQRTHEFSLAALIADRIADALGETLPQSEVAYIAIHLASKGLLSDEGNEGPLVIPDEVWDIVGRMLERVWGCFRFDFRNDLELRMNLARHIVPLAVRMQYRMNLQNPILNDVRVRFPLAYSMASESSLVLEEAYGSRLSADEVGYLAMAFALALDRKKTEPQKKRILIVCASGIGSARLLEYRVRREFSSYLESVRTCDATEVERQDFSRIDYVFTTVPIRATLPVPVREIRYFLDACDVDVMRRVFECYEDKDVRSFFDERLFFPHLSLKTKREVLDFLCEQAVEVGGAPATLRGLVETREKAMPTSFGNSVAMPHPFESVGTRTFVTVGLLDKPVIWDERGTQVQAVFLVTFDRSGDTRLDSFFSSLADLFVSERLISALVGDQTWGRFLAVVSDGTPRGMTPPYRAGSHTKSVTST